ncbi:MAG: disulfide bond formation protein DsbA [Ponticaulis sp.]|nr:disulfide bond formation protein DsbA [Ponticaulis sp.]|tara:strand:- start:10966 stop:11643 length:678 start_codon:yes stop_codon:yes gene_type:complete
MTVLIDMVSDIVCPWCWLGLRRLEGAIAATKDEFETQIVFRAFQLDPNVPKAGVDYKTYMASKFGPDDSGAASEQKNRWTQMREALEQYGAEDGIPFDFAGMTIRPNTLNAHRLLKWAQGQNKAHQLKNNLFHAYFAEHRDIGDAEVLADLGYEAGMDRDLLLDLLKGEADLAAVKQEEASIRQLGINGVPTFIANRKIAAQGAESVENLANFLRQAASEYPLEA